LAYELETIESKINENISFATSENIEFDVPEFLKELDHECAKVKKAFRHQVVSFENEKLVRRYFHFHQESLIDLINNIQTCDAAANPNLLDSIIARLSSLLTYLEEHFPEYFDLDMRMPQASRAFIERELTSFGGLISGKFTATNIDIGLIEILKKTVEQFVGKEETISFRRFYYLRFLKANLANFQTDDNPETLDLLRILMHCNFNEDAFYKYIVRFITWSLNKTQSVGEKLDELGFYLKFANQETSSSHLAFDHHSPPINVQVADWISQEAQYLKNKQQLAPYSVRAEDAVTSEFKLSFDLSVSILAYLFRAFTETGVIQNKNTSELIRFLTKYVKTKRSESISYESFRIKYYSAESGTKEGVKKMLQSLLNFVNKN
jgi:hypothetical protein